MRSTPSCAVLKLTHLYVGAATARSRADALPLIDHYEHLAHDLRSGESSVKAIVTELVHAQLHRAPDTAEDARELLPEWRELEREF